MNVKIRKSLRSGAIISLVLFVIIVFFGASSMYNALWVSALGGFLIAGSMYFFFIPTGGGDDTTVILENGEKALMREGASYFYDGEEIGGMMYLTQSMLIFKADVMSLRRVTVEFFVRDIEGVKNFKSYGNVDNGLEVAIKFDKSYRFGLKNNKRWLERIEEAANLNEEE